jgi:hypothetical protein
MKWFGKDGKFLSRLPSWFSKSALEACPEKSKIAQLENFA